MDCIREFVSVGLPKAFPEYPRGTVQRQGCAPPRSNHHVLDSEVNAGPRFQHMWPGRKLVDSRNPSRESPGIETHFRMPELPPRRKQNTYFARARLQHHGLLVEAVVQRSRPGSHQVLASDFRLHIHVSLFGHFGAVGDTSEYVFLLQAGIFCE